MPDGVGPVLWEGVMATAILAAIRDENQDVAVIDRGAYLRVLVPGRCSVSREALERRVGGRFVLPGDLEKVMSSFKGRLTITSERVTWESAAAGRRPR